MATPLQQRLQGMMKPKGLEGILSRGNNVYRGFSNAAHTGGGIDYPPQRQSPGGGPVQGFSQGGGGGAGLSALAEAAARRLNVTQSQLTPTPTGQYPPDMMSGARAFPQGQQAPQGPPGVTPMLQRVPSSMQPGGAPQMGGAPPMQPGAAPPQGPPPQLAPPQMAPPQGGLGGAGGFQQPQTPMIAGPQSAAALSRLLSLIGR